MKRGITLSRLVMLCLVVTTISPTFAAAADPDPDKVAESIMVNGSFTAKIYFASNDRSYTGFDAAAAASIQPELTWADGDAVAQGVANIAQVNAAGTRVMLETLSASGTSFCIAHRPAKRQGPGTVRGMDSAGGTFGTYVGCKNAPSGSWG